MMSFSKKKSDVNQPKNQRPSEKFQECSGIFMQLGLVLALFMAYMALEYTSERSLAFIDTDLILTDDYVEIAPPDYTVEPNVEKKEPEIKKIVKLIEFKKVPDKNTTAEVILGPPDPKVLPNIVDIVTAPDPVDEPEAVPFIFLEDAPIFPGCEGLEGVASKACFTKQMTRFVNRKFDSSIAEGLNLSGRQRITVQFTIDKMGLVADVMIRAPHKRLDKEARRVIGKLPQMIPGMQRKRPVPVKYTLPIVFDIQ